MPPNLLNQDIVLYHGTTLPHALKIVKDGVDLAFAKPRTDFGRGFYVTTRLRQANRFAERLAGRQRLPAHVVQFVVDRDMLSKLDTAAFVVGDQEAADFWSLVNFCRGGTAGHGRHINPAGSFYDVVFGPVTKNYYEMTLYDGYDQVSFHTDKAVALLNLPGRRSMI